MEFREPTLVPQEKKETVEETKAKWEKFMEGGNISTSLESQPLRGQFRSTETHGEGISSTSAFGFEKLVESKLLSQEELSDLFKVEAKEDEKTKELMFTIKLKDDWQEKIREAFEKNGKE